MLSASFWVLVAAFRSVFLFSEGLYIFLSLHFIIIIVRHPGIRLEEGILDNVKMHFKRGIFCPPQKEFSGLEKVQKLAARRIKGMEQPPCEGRLQCLGLFG